MFPRVQYVHVFSLVSVVHGGTGQWFNPRSQHNVFLPHFQLLSLYNEGALSPASSQCQKKNKTLNISMD